jgi:hypothetical protein
VSAFAAARGILDVKIGKARRRIRRGCQASAKQYIFLEHCTNAVEEEEEEKEISGFQMEMKPAFGCQLIPHSSSSSSLHPSAQGCQMNKSKQTTRISFVFVFVLLVAGE